MIARYTAAAAVVLLLLSPERLLSLPATEIAPDGAGTCSTTITQSTSQVITLGNSVACSTGDPNYYHRESSYWRAFNMASFAGSQAYNVVSVSFGVERAHSGSGLGQPITVRLYTSNGGAFPGGFRTEIASANATVTDQTGTIVSVPLTVTVPAATSQLVMEVFTPDGVPPHNVFFIGSNAAAQTGPSYISAAACGSPDPIDMATINFPDSHVVFNITGSCANGAPAKALNISTRLRVELGDNAMIAGFVISGSAPKSIVLRGMGPSLIAAGITDVLSDPVVELHGSNGSLIYMNNDWQDDPAQVAQIQGTAYQPGDNRESAMIQTLSPAAYTAIVTGRNQTTGVALVEVYDNSQIANSQLGNLSTRGFVQAGNNVMIGGFILGGATGVTHVAIRGVGPSLAQAGLSNVLADPTLELHDGNGTTLVSNDNWQDDATAAAQLSSRGLGLQNSLESGIYVSLVPGAYTAILAGKSGGMGIGLVELYNLQ